MFSFLWEVIEVLYTKITRLEIPSNIQTNWKFTEATSNIERKINILSKIFAILEIGKNSIIKRNKRAEKPAKKPKAFHDPKRLAVLSVKIPNDVILGKNKWTIWKTKTRAEDIIVPSKNIFARPTVRKKIEEKNIKIKAEKTNQNEPTSNMVPNKDTFRFPEKRAESKKVRATPNPAKSRVDLGKTIRRSKNRAIPQRTIQTTIPTTKSSPLEISTGMLVKGRKKIGNKTTTKNKEMNENLSSIFESMC